MKVYLTYDAENGLESGPCHYLSSQHMMGWIMGCKTLKLIIYNYYYYDVEASSATIPESGVMFILASRLQGMLAENVRIMFGRFGGV